MKFAIIKYKRFTQETFDSMPVIEDAEGRLPIQRRDGNIFYCGHPDGHMQVFEIHQIEAFYDSDSDLTLTVKEVERIRGWL